MRLSHLGLPVIDIQRSRQFYETYFGFDPATAQRYEDGTVIVRNVDGFDLALHTAEKVDQPPEFLHFGFRSLSADEVRALLVRLETDGVQIIERSDRPSYVGFKALDPDGHRVETYWEPASPAGN